MDTRIIDRRYCFRYIVVKIIIIGIKTTDITLAKCRILERRIFFIRSVVVLFIFL
jgi:hypothetical protein